MPGDDPDGVSLWRTGEIDASRQSPRRPRPRPGTGQEARPTEGSAQDRERHTDASERRQRHTEGGGTGRRRQWHRAAGEEGDGGRNGEGGVMAIATVTRSNLPSVNLRACVRVPPLKARGRDKGHNQ
jgi:hypothetical protein